MLSGILSGMRCHVCGMALENPHYGKDEAGFGLYWANPKICQYTDVRVDFCGPICANTWWAEKMGVHRTDGKETDAGLPV